MTQRRTNVETPISPTTGRDWLLDGAGLEAGAGAAWTFAAATECREALQAFDRDLKPDLDRVYSLEHKVPIGEGRHLHVIEYFTLCSWLLRPRRAVLFLQGSVHKGNCWSIPVPGYNGTEMAARRGMFSYTVDFIGGGRSHTPVNGLDATLEKNVEALRSVLRYIRFCRAVPKVDLVGEGYGGIMATQLAADSRRVKSCVMTNTLYKEMIGGPAKSPEMVEHLTHAPNGYFTVPPAAYDTFVIDAPSEVLDYLHSTQPGDYPTPGMLIILGDPPFFDPAKARVPGLVIFGAKDAVLAPNDPHYLAADYGKEGADLVIHDKGGHALRLESPETASWFWTKVFNFIESGYKHQAENS